MHLLEGLYTLAPLSLRWACLACVISCCRGHDVFMGTEVSFRKRDIACLCLNSEGKKSSLPLAGVKFLLFKDDIRIPVRRGRSSWLTGLVKHWHLPLVDLSRLGTSDREQTFPLSTSFPKLLLSTESFHRLVDRVGPRHHGLTGSAT